VRPRDAVAPCALGDGGASSRLTPVGWKALTIEHSRSMKSTAEL
jgi:hypothetical protein